MLRPHPPLTLIASQFSVQAQEPAQQLLAWRERVGHVIDVLPTRPQLENPFYGSLKSYRVGDLMLTDCRSDALSMERSVARISTDNIRNYAFHLFLEGGISTMSGGYQEYEGACHNISILALDMDQPIRMHREASRLLTLFVPRALVEQLLPEAPTIHGRVLKDDSAQKRLLIDHVIALNQYLPTMDPMQAEQAMRTAMTLLIHAFGKQAGLLGSARAAIRAAMFGRVRRYIEHNLYQTSLSPESIVNALQLPRRTLYRLFEHEGGLEAYIRSSKLRAAANDLIGYPQLSVLDVAFGLGFKSASHFTRAFHRTFDMSPQDFRAIALRRSSAGPG
jgi:AraC-like DNA-binding protein